MPSISRVGEDGPAGVVIEEAGAPTVFVEGSPIGVTNVDIEPYGNGCKANPKTDEASSVVFAEGKAVVRDTDKDKCGTPIDSSSSTFAG